jgi:hypothetical protein
MDAKEASSSAAAAGRGASAEGEAEMEMDFSHGGVVPSFEFAFISANFSDRVLRLEIVASDGAMRSNGEEKGAYVASRIRG